MCESVRICIIFVSNKGDFGFLWCVLFLFVILNMSSCNLHGVPNVYNWAVGSSLIKLQIKKTKLFFILQYHTATQQHHLYSFLYVTLTAALLSSHRKYWKLMQVMFSYILQIFMYFFPLHAIYGTEFLKSVQWGIIFLYCLLLLLTSRIVNIMNRIVGL